MHPDQEGIGKADVDIFFYFTSDGIHMEHFLIIQKSTRGGT